MTQTDQSFLRLRSRPRVASDGRLTVVDLFAGCGGLVVGLWEAARRARLKLDVALAVDLDPIMAMTFRRNMIGSRAVAAAVEAFFPADPGEGLTPVEERLAWSIAPVDVLCGGPPCQGHSDLNNHTRRRDDRNRLYLRMARAAEVLRPAVVLIENVPAVRHDAGGVVDETALQLEKLGYRVKAEVVDLSLVGVPQRRRRHLLVATRLDGVDPAAAFSAIQSGNELRTVEWAIGDLANRADPLATIDTPSVASAENKRRMKFLFENELFELPDSERPPCHRDKPHSYRAVYGRLRWDQPAPTITTGFGSMGQGRFVHPSQQRTLTPHEAARLQTFPDWFDWGDATPRGRLATMIGNAVPPLLTVKLGGFWIPHIVQER